MARRIQRSIALLLAAGALAPAAQPDGAQLLRQATEAIRQNRREAVFFVFQEHITQREWNVAGELTGANETGYEVLMIENELYHRRVSRNGHPLVGEELAGEDRRMRQVTEFRKRTPVEERRRRFAAAERTRLRFDMRLLAEHHLARFDGEAACATGPCLVLSVWPKPKAPKPRGPYEWTLTLRGHLWLDRETLHPVRADVEQAIDFHGQPAGSRTVFEFARLKGVWLLQRAHSTVAGRRRPQSPRRETTQVYSDFQRFQAESVIMFSDYQ